LVKDIAQAKQEGMSQIKFRFPMGQFRKDDPEGLVPQHASQVSSCLLHAHGKFEYKVFTENSQDWDEVVQRMVEPKMTRFKAMSMDEHEGTIEKLTEEALRSKEEIKVVEETRCITGDFL
jgi:hypothetical protein